MLDSNNIQIDKAQYAAPRHPLVSVAGGRNPSLLGDCKAGHKHHILHTFIQLVITIYPIPYILARLCSGCGEGVSHCLIIQTIQEESMSLQYGRQQGSTNTQDVPFNDLFIPFEVGEEIIRSLEKE